MRSKLLILFLCVCVACTNSRLNKENITITVDVEKIPEYGFVISNQDGHMQTLEFDTNRHAEYIIENLEAAYLTLHNGFSENINFYAEKGDQIHLTYDGISMEKTLKTENIRMMTITAVTLNFISGRKSPGSFSFILITSNCRLLLFFLLL